MGMFITPTGGVCIRSNRNKNKPFRPMREGNILDNLPLGYNGARVNTTGCFGVVNTYTNRVKMYGPQTGKRRDSKCKSGCKVFSSSQIDQWEGKDHRTRVQHLRNRLRELRAIGDFCGRDFLGTFMSKALSNCNKWLMLNMPEQEFKGIFKKDAVLDVARDASYQKDGISMERVRRLNQEIRELAKATELLGIFS